MNEPATPNTTRNTIRIYAPAGHAWEGLKAQLIDRSETYIVTNAGSFARRDGIWRHVADDAVTIWPDAEACAAPAAVEAAS